MSGENVSNNDMLSVLNSEGDKYDHLSDGETVEVMGVELRCDIEQDVMDSDLTMRLYCENATFIRKGFKEISYGAWVDSNWCTEWEQEV